MGKHHIVVENIVVDVVKKRIRNVHLRVRPPRGQVCLSAPIGAKDSALRDFVMSKISWIKRHRNRFENSQDEFLPEFVSGENHQYRGQNFILNVIYHDSKPRIEIHGNGQMDLYVRMASDQSVRERVISNWYREQLKMQINHLMEKWQSLIGVDAVSWNIRRMRTRWGSCMVSSRRICFNLELAKKPPKCIEFIVVHELTHLLERYHNKRFKAFMDLFMPEWRDAEQELNHKPL
ncbi:MAG: M48 family metallopeptidase [Desulfomonilaceae bacterium]